MTRSIIYSLFNHSHVICTSRSPRSIQTLATIQSLYTNSSSALLLALGSFTHLLQHLCHLLSLPFATHMSSQLQHTSQFIIY